MIGTDTLTGTLVITAHSSKTFIRSYTATLDPSPHYNFSLGTLSITHIGRPGLPASEGCLLLPINPPRQYSNQLLFQSTKTLKPKT